MTEKHMHWPSPVRRVPVISRGSVLMLGWQHGMVVSIVQRMNEVTPRRTQLDG